MWSGDDVELVVCERQRGGIGLHELHLRVTGVPFAADGDHALGEVSSDDMSARFRQRDAGGARPGGDVENALAALGVHGAGRGQPPESRIPNRQNGVRAVVVGGNGIEHGSDLLGLLIEVCSTHLPSLDCRWTRRALNGLWPRLSR